MLINFLGDSITEGVGASSYEKCFVKVVEKTLGCKVNNYGISGTRIAKQKSISKPHSFDMFFSSRLNFIEKSADYIFVFGGTNDYGHGDAPFGDISDCTEDTFYGAINLLVDKLLEVFSIKQIIFLLPLKRFNEEETLNFNQKGLYDYVEAIKQVLTKRRIEYIDTYNDGIVKPITNLGDEYTVDGLHPNDRGHALIAKKICDKILSM